MAYIPLGTIHDRFCRCRDCKPPYGPQDGDGEPSGAMGWITITLILAIAIAGAFAIWHL